ncbi:MAG: efflux RND transporter permease subunit [Gammaproteobacteria bacterium]
MHKSFIHYFVKHRIVADLLMLIMVLGGVYSLNVIDVKFFPRIQPKIINITIKWPGSTSEDVEELVTTPIESKLKQLNDVKRIKSTSSDGYSRISINFKYEADMSEAFEQVRQDINLVRNLPAGTEKPIIERIHANEMLCKIIVWSTEGIEVLRPYVKKIEGDLLQYGIPKIKIFGLPRRELNVEIPSKTLFSEELSLADIANLLKNKSFNQPIGTLGENTFGKSLRIYNQSKEIKTLADIPLIHNKKARVVTLGNIASITMGYAPNETLVYYNTQPAVELELLETKTANTFESAKKLQSWIEKEAKQFPSTINIKIYSEFWKFIQERVNLLVKNGLIGIILIAATLILILNWRATIWVVIGIPVAVLASFIALYLLGGTIDMVSLFAVVMMLGIIVDDNVVVAEEIVSLVESGKPPEFAATYGAKRMFTPVLVSSITTIAAFCPLLLLKTDLGDTLIEIPQMAVCIVIASLIECFLVMPAHIHHALKGKKHSRPLLEKQFNYFVKEKFAPLIKVAMHYREVVLASAIAIFIISLSLIYTNHVKFVFFPSPESQLLVGEAAFISGISDAEKISFIHMLNHSLKETEKYFSKEKKLVVANVNYLNQSGYNFITRNFSDNLVGFNVELISSNEREVRNSEFINAWKKRIKLPAGIRKFSITEERTSTPGEDIDIRVYGDQLNQLKKIAEHIKNYLSNIDGVTDIKDNLPYSGEQLIFTLTEKSHALNLTLRDIGDQILHAFTGFLTQIHYDNDDEVEVRVRLPESERNNYNLLNYYPIKTPTGKTLPLQDLVNIRHTHGYDNVPHTSGKRAVNITAYVNYDINNPNLIIKQLKLDILDRLSSAGIKYEIAGKHEEQGEMFAEMKLGSILAILIIYIALAWVFHSYIWPLVVLAIVPIALSGAIFGHFIMGMNLSTVSIFGFFGLAGIIINDSIILLKRFQELLPEYHHHAQEAILQAACQRIRPILITTITTVIGLMPMLFEQSTQTKFIVPMAVSISFGLLLGSVFLLILLPCLISYVESIKLKINTVSIFKGE